jgi:hypothetical protein
VASETKDVRRIRRGCTDRELRALLLAAISAGHRYKMTKSGVVFYGPAGTAGTHFTHSDHRGTRNFRSLLQRAGIDIEKGK